MEELVGIQVLDEDELLDLPVGHNRKREEQLRERVLVVLADRVVVNLHKLWHMEAKGPRVKGRRLTMSAAPASKDVEGREVARIRAQPLPYACGKPPLRKAVASTVGAARSLKSSGPLARRSRMQRGR